jgi:transposase
MPRTYKVTAENAMKIREAMSERANAESLMRLQAVALRGEGKNNKEIGSITGYHPSYVSHLVSVYCNEGLEQLCGDKRVGGNHCNMTNEEEKAFLSQFEEAAKAGQVITIADIAVAYDKKTGKERDSNSTVYYLLHKHGWRQITPQTAHPGKASEATIEASKKLT